MKVKEVERTANVAWSPADVTEVYLAAGTAAQQLDATFSSSAQLELFSLALDSPGSMDLPTRAVTPSPVRFHCLAWGHHGLKSGKYPAGMLVGGSDGGLITIYNPHQLLAGNTEGAVVQKAERHTGAVRALDFNPFQPNLLASGASDSELFIWDLNNPGTPMTPGAKSQPPEDVSAVCWNKQVQHIMASTFASRCVVWDLRKNEPIIKVSDGQAGMKCKVVAWHPDVATQLVLASEDDHTPVIQLWDLRFATSPLRSFEKHQKGILSLSWCQRDSHLLLSAGKDDKILCWDPHVDIPGGQVVAELSASPQWNFSVGWCPRNPALIAGCSFDGRISVYNVMGRAEEPIASPTSKLAESFPDMSGVAAALPAVQRRTSVPLTRPPSWIKRPCGASFGFGGRLVSFYNSRTADGQPVRHVEIRRVVTEPELIERSEQFTEVVLGDTWPQYCDSRAQTAGERDQLVWRFLAAKFSPQPRSELIGLLGYHSQMNGGDANEVTMQDQSGSGQDQDEGLNGGEGDAGDAFDLIARRQADGANDSPTAEPEELFDIPVGDDTDGLVSQAVLRGDMKEAVDLCIQADRVTDALIIAHATSQELFETTRNKYLEGLKTDLSRLIGALVTRDWSQVVTRCDPGSWKEALVAVLTHAPHEQTAQLCEQLGARLEVQHTEAMWTNALLCYVCAGSVDRLVQCWERTRPDVTSSPLVLQDLIEQVMTLTRANQLAGQPASDLPSGGAQRKLLEYAQLLTSQGSLETALTYLGNCTDPAAAALCERVQHALNPAAPTPGHSVSGRSTVYQQQQTGGRRISQTGTGYTSPPTMPVAPSPVVSQPQRYPSGPYQPPTAPVAPVAPTPAPMVPTAPTAPQVPPGGPAAGSGGYRLGGRRQYVADPSMAGSGVGSVGYGMGSMPVAGSVSSPMYGTMAPPAPAVNNVYTPHYGTAALYPEPSQPQPGVSTFTPAPSGVPGEFSTGPGLGVGSPPVPPAPPSVSSGPGWNDPPPLRAGQTRKSVTSTVSLLQTITQPIYNPAEMVSSTANQYGMMYPPSGGPAGPSGGAAAPGGGYQVPPGPAPSGQFSPYQQQQQMSPTPAAQPQPQSQPEPPADKGPVPAEHAAIQETLDRLRDACLSASGNPQVRRRLEDVSRKLELLYDLLRQGQLSAPTLAGLHQLVGYIQYGDLGSAQAALQQLVATSNFAEISRFMPGVKTLVQIAGQLQVHI